MNADQSLNQNDLATVKLAMEKLKHTEITDKIIKAFFHVYNILGYGFLEKIYENALTIELQKLGLSVVSQHPIRVFYENIVVGEYFADILVEDVLVVELKCVDHLSDDHMAQCINYLCASRREVCLLVNYQRPKVEWKRIVHRFTNAEPRSLASACRSACR